MTGSNAMSGPLTKQPGAKDVAREFASRVARCGAIGSYPGFTGRIIIAFHCRRGNVSHMEYLASHMTLTASEVMESKQ